LRGLARSQAHWGEFLDHFRARFPGDRIDTPDLPGCGARREVTAPLDVAGTLQLIRGGLAPTGPLWLVGLSMGGMVAYEWARRWPDEVAGLVLINTSLGGLSAPWRRLRWAALPQVIAAAWGDPLARERRIHGFTSRQGAAKETVVAAWAALARDQPVRRGNALRQLLAAARFRAAPLPAPTRLLVLASARDGMVDPACSRAIVASLPGATLIEHATAGHDLPLDDPAWVVTEIGRWAPLIEGTA
jgi:pimeloyl-ACP methyl ester carboxylesterase